MLIELKWLDQNTGNGQRKTEIYRSTAPFNVIDDAVKIATVDKGINTYLDTDVVQGQIYYYRFRIVSSSSVSPLSRQFTFDANPYTGPGRSATIFGDENFGYYGPYPQDGAAVPSLNDIREKLGLARLADDLDSYPHKFAIGGSVRGTYGQPVALGTELSRTDPIMTSLLAGEPMHFSMGLHDWAIVIPSAEHASNPEHSVEHFPGELRSMLGVITDLYARVEDANTGNSTGGKVSVYSGQIPFYDVLANRYPDEPIKWMVSCDWTGDSAIAVNWTQPDGPPPARPKELHIELVDYTDPVNWDQTLIWPVLIYTGLTGPIDGR